MTNETSPAVEEIKDDEVQLEQFVKPTQIAARDLPYPKFCCKNNHILGQIIKIKRGEYHITRLSLWAVSPNFDDILPIGLAEHLSRGFIDAGAIYCSHPGCGEMREWFPGEDYIERIQSMKRSRRAAK